MPKALNESFHLDLDQMMSRNISNTSLNESRRSSMFIKKSDRKFINQTEENEVRLKKLKTLKEM